MPDPIDDRALALRVLDTALDPDNDAGAGTVRDYLTKLLLTLWDEGEGFSGKRPLGNSGWEGDLIGPLIRDGLIDGALDEYGYIEEADWDKGPALVAAAIRELGRP